ncbi:UNVERIFIED_CONTAM: hypothetical protein NY100_07375 [Prevotella sp. 15_C9]
MNKKSTLRVLATTTLFLVAGMCPSIGFAQTNYDLFIAGTQITSENAENLTGEWLKSGEASFDNTTNTLTLKDAFIEAKGDDNGIKSEMKNLTIRLEGNNSIKSVHGTGIYNDANGNMTITGDSLKVETEQQSAIFTGYDSKLTIINCRIGAKGLWGITGVTGMKNEQLTIKNAAVNAYGKYLTIGELANVELDNSLLIAPKNAKWNSEYHSFCIQNEPIGKRTIVIKPDTDNGIAQLNTPEQTTTKEIYDLSGRKIKKLKRGINIVRSSNGKTNKTILR